MVFLEELVPLVVEVPQALVAAGGRGRFRRGETLEGPQVEVGQVVRQDPSQGLAT